MSAEPRGGLSEALDAVGDRWTLLVIAALLEAPLRFGELQERLEGIAPNVLSQRLRALQERGIVVAEPYSERPPRFTYQLGAAGHELAGALRLLSAWGARHTDSDVPRHDLCGTPLEVAWYCPTCREPVADGDQAEETHYA